jgi:hypothetical protein
MTKLKALLLLNFSVGHLALSIHFSSYTLRWLPAEWLIPFGAFILSLGSSTLIRRSKVNVPKWMKRLALWPGSVSFLLSNRWIFLAFCSIFYFSEIANQVTVSSIESPDGRLTAEVVFRPVGAYAPGAGKVFIRTIWNALPFIHRQEFFSTVYSVPEMDFAHWVDNDSLQISEPSLVIHIPEPNLSPIAIWIIGVVLILEKSLTSGKLNLK